MALGLPHGERSADLFQQYYEELVDFLIRRGCPPDVAHDIVCEAIARAKSVKSIRNLIAYLKTVSIRIYYARLKKASKDLPFDDLIESKLVNDMALEDSILLDQGKNAFECLVDMIFNKMENASNKKLAFCVLIGKSNIELYELFPKMSQGSIRKIRSRFVSKLKETVLHVDERLLTKEQTILAFKKAKDNFIMKYKQDYLS